MNNDNIQSIQQCEPDLVPENSVTKQDTPADTPEAHWERFKEATRKVFTTPKAAPVKKP